MKGIFMLQAAAYSTWVLPASREPQAASLRASGGGEAPGGACCKPRAASCKAASHGGGWRNPTTSSLGG